MLIFKDKRTSCCDGIRKRRTYAISPLIRVYEKHDQFEEVYQEIVQTLLQKAKDRQIIYAVPGHPLVAERTVQLLLEYGPKEGVEIFIGGGQSFIDALFQSLKIDPVDGFQLLDGTSLHSSQLQIDQHIFISQVYDQFVASILS